MRPHLSPYQMAEHLDRLATQIEAELPQRGLSNQGWSKAVLRSVERARAFQDAASFIRLTQRDWDEDLDPGEP